MSHNTQFISSIIIMTSQRQRFYKNKIKRYLADIHEATESIHPSYSQNGDSHIFLDSSSYRTSTEDKENCVNNFDIEVNKEIEEFEKEKFTENMSLRQEKRRVSNDSLHPTITEVIGEKDMEKLRKSLEDDNAEKDMEILRQSLEDGNVKKDMETERKASDKEKKKRKQTELKKNYVDFLSEDEDFVWDSTSWKDTDGSSTHSSDSNQKKRKESRKDQIQKMEK
ncbi:unnamed protein product [Euphydryas editha]|uniref:Uncharacterized protein n=1 Tax=Euphydryas editha TaxID=104508 RepID=A0AAU9UXJ1_EUPED|nr:unnamed protein product [Euphydryas editha]